MERFVIIEIGSTNTKAYLCNHDEVTKINRKTIEFKNHYKIAHELTKEDKEKLYDFIASINEENIYVYGTSIFRELDENQKEAWIKEFKEKTGLDFTIVTPDMENIYTVYGVIRNIDDYKENIAIMIGGGGSTELSIVKNKKIIEKANSSFGAMDTTAMFPDIKTDIATSDLKEMIEKTIELVNNPQNKADILILAGGEYLYFFEMVKQKMGDNRFFKDELQPYMLTLEEMYAFDEKYFYHTSLEKICKETNDDGWWRGTRGMRICVRALAKVLDAKYIIPSNINMVYGIAEEIKKNKQN